MGEAELDAEIDRAVDSRLEAKRLEAWGYVLSGSGLFAGYRFNDPEEVKRVLAGMTAYDREEAIVRSVARMADYIENLEERLNARIDEAAGKHRRDDFDLD